MTRPFHKHKTLLDENMPDRHGLPQLNAHFDVRHVRDLRYAGRDDPSVYALAVKLGRIIVTRNVKHFRDLAGTRDDAGIIGIPPTMLSSQVDAKLTAFLKKTSPASLRGKYVPLAAGDTR